MTVNKNNIGGFVRKNDQPFFEELKAEAGMHDIGIIAYMIRLIRKSRQEERKRKEENYREK